MPGVEVARKSSVGNRSSLAPPIFHRSGRMTGKREVSELIPVADNSPTIGGFFLIRANDDIACPSTESRSLPAQVRENGAGGNLSDEVGTVPGARTAKRCTLASQHLSVRPWICPSKLLFHACTHDAYRDFIETTLRVLLRAFL